MTRLIDGIRHFRLPRLGQVGRLMLLAAMVGIVAGAGAIAFHWLSHLVAHHALGMLAGYQGGGPAGETGGEQMFGAIEHSGLSPWWLLGVITLGGLFSGLIVFGLAPEAEGHGTDAAIDAYHNKRGVIRSRVPIIKMITSAVTIGTGGSGGREGPIAQIGAGFGSFLATRLRLSDFDRRILLAAGLGAGVGAIFRAPLAGAIFAIEVLYRDPDFEAEALIPAFISTTIAYCVYGLAFGFDPLFVVEPVAFDQPMLLAPLAVLALVMALASLLYVRTFYGITALFHRLPGPKHVRPAIGALLTGLVGLGIYYPMRAWAGQQAGHDALSVLSFGYGILQNLFYGRLPADLTVAVTLLVAVGLGKILTTSLTIGSGGSGGVFGPSMVIGGTLGAAVGLLMRQWMPTLVTRIDVFVILGMASFFAAAAKTPVSTLIIVSEMTASYKLLLPAMWVCAIAYIVSRSWTLYCKQVAGRINSPAHRGDFLIDVLEGLTVADAWKQPDSPPVVVPPGMPLRDVVKLIAGTTQSTFPVVDSSGQIIGLFSMHDVRQFLYEPHMGEIAVAQDLARASAPPFMLDTDLGEAVARFAAVTMEELPIVSDAQGGSVIGMLRRHDVISAYNAQILKLHS